MFISQIGITGHRPSGFANKSAALEIAGQVVSYCKHIFHNVEFNLGGCIGADMWVAQACVEQDVPYRLWLPFPVDIQAKMWAADERQALAQHALLAKEVSIVGQHYKVANYHIRDQQIVDNSHLIICFWEGRRSGGTYNTIKYALKSGRQVLNAMNELQEVIL